MTQANTWIWNHYCNNSNCSITDFLTPWKKSATNASMIENIYDEKLTLPYYKVPWKNNPNGGAYQLYINFEKGGFDDKEGRYKINFLCDVPKESRFRLRGLCLNTSLDTEYTLFQTKKQFFWLGASKSVISFNGTWYASVLDSEVSAVARSPFQSLLLGVHDWIINKDFACSGRENDLLELSLNACNDDEFNCRNGECIPIQKRCNGIPNCSDKSDEKQCGILITDRNYNSAKVDEKGHNSFPLKVKVVLQHFMTISEREGKTRVQYEIQLEWRDTRLMFQNFKNSTFENELSSGEVANVWKPKLILKDIDLHHRNTHVEEKVTVERNANSQPHSADISHLHNAKIYSGRELTMISQVSYSSTFACTFMLEMYPFDVQVCHIRFTFPPDQWEKFRSAQLFINQLI